MQRTDSPSFPDNWPIRTTDRSLFSPSHLDNWPMTIRLTIHFCRSIVAAKFVACISHLSQLRCMVIQTCCRGANMVTKGSGCWEFSPPCHLATLPPWHLATLPPCHLACWRHQRQDWLLLDSATLDSGPSVIVWSVIYHRTKVMAKDKKVNIAVT